ncbi:YdcF family protein [Rhizobium sp. FKY42]|uniref:YdcF family protein n=1 Tax=Rhizobium sp. FKY42 TaxID=2562310 RepID=UPI0010C13914|nr:YdcF family protein [Rhizobium sp. FKY42]
MFYLSKIVWLVAQPLSLVFLAILLALLLSLAGWRRSGFLFSSLAALMLFVTLYTTTGNVLLQRLENQAVRPQQHPASVSCIIMLGGAIENDVMDARGGIEFNAAADRYTQTVNLALKYPHAKLIVSGGDGSFSGRYEGEAKATEGFFADFGITAERLIKENSSRNTFENSANTKDVLSANGLADCLLVTSAFHMPRAMALFAKMGISVVPYPVDYRTTGKTSLSFDFTQPSLNAQNMATAVREWLAIIAYRLAGRTK